jgi:hypothetical protein
VCAAVSSAAALWCALKRLAGAGACCDCSQLAHMQAQYVRDLVQLAVARQDADTRAPGELIFSQKGGGVPRPARVVGCIMAPESASGQAQLDVNVTKLQAQLALSQPWRPGDALFLSALSTWRAAEILNIQTCVEKLIIVHEARTPATATFLAH